MNPITDLTYEEKVSLLTLSNQIPKSKGMIFKQFKMIKLSQIEKCFTDKIDSITGNLVRAKGLDQTKVLIFQQLIENGGYVFTCQQPIVVKTGKNKYRLLCGEHRYNAHAQANLNLTEMLCAVVEFENNYWMHINQSVENKEKFVFVKNERTDDDIVVSLSGFVRDGYVDINDDSSINQCLKDLEVTKTNSWPKLREKLRNEFGVASPVKSYDAKSRFEFAQKIIKGITLYSKKTKKLTDGVAYLTTMFKGGSGPGGVQDLDYDARICPQATKIILENRDVKEVHVLSSISDATSNKLRKIRDYKTGPLMKDHIHYCMQVADAYRSGVDFVNMVKFKFVPQIEGVDNPKEFI